MIVRVTQRTFSRHVSSWDNTAIKENVNSSHVEVIKRRTVYLFVIFLVFAWDTVIKSKNISDETN